jgi:VanZ family protein
VPLHAPACDASAVPTAAVHFGRVFVTILLCIPGTELPKVTWSTKIWLDKWVHIFLFLVLVWFWCRAYKSIEKIKAKKTFIAITVLSIFYGVIMEIIQQYFIPFRSFDVGDMIADSIGAIAGYFISIKRFLLKN